MRVNYWDIVSECEWGKDSDFDRIGNYLKIKYPKEVCQKLLDFCHKKESELIKVLNRYSLKKTGNKYAYFLQDDSGSDLRAHIIGLGREEYENVIKNPELARKRGDKNDYEENFFYSFHFLPGA